MMLNRVSLNTIGLNRIGLNRIGKPSRGSSERPYIDPEVLASLKAVCICYGKSNEDPDRAIVKNLVDPDNPFVISNAAFKLNSGFGKYEDDFTNWVAETGTKLTSDKITNSNPTKNWIAYRSSGVEFKEMHIRILGIPDNGALYFQRPAADGGPIKMFNGDNNIPAFTSTGICGFFINNLTGLGWSNLVIEQIPSFEDAFVTDGIDDLITSTKTVQEMLGGSTEFTAVSMVHLISSGQDVYGNAYTNYIRTSDNYWTSNRVSNVGKTGIYGYSFKQGTPTVINNILGDKNDYTTEKSDIVSDSSVSDLFRAKFSVEGFEHVINGAVHVSSVAWYWTIIANKVLTTDQINQVIAYFNLDRTLRPDIYCNIAKQGITNENHAEFGDKLIDFSGNGRDIQLNNLAWKGDSGIGKYEVDFLDSSIWNSSNSTITSSKIDCKNAISHIMLLYYSVGSKEYPDIPSFKVIKTGADIDYSYIDETGSPKSVKIVDGVNVLPASHNTLYSGSGRFCGFGNPGMGNSVTITQIPSHAGALCFDGVEDYGKVTGLPIYKDYTVIADYIRTFAKENVQDAPILSKSKEGGDGAFIFNYVDYSTSKTLAYSFANINNVSYINDFERNIYYQSKYTNNGNSINAGTGVDTNSMWLGTYRDNVQNYFTGAIYSLMSFPYSLSEFLIERQLKKHKLGTLYPDMVEFRPVITINGESGDISYANDKWENINIGDYINIGEIVHILLYRKDIEEISNVKVNGAKFQSIDFDSIYNHWNINIELTSKSPQKIDITIDEYIRYEDIVQPYPVLLRFNDENGNEVSWGGKFKVGSTITRIVSFNDCNLLKGIYTVSNAKLNGSPLSSTPHVVERQMVFTCTATYLLDDNEPKCILSPRLLRIPNSSYKILGYIPDISGHGNHGKINNSAYALNSGANGYLVDFNSWVKTENVTLTDNKITVIKDKITYKWISYVTKGSVVPTFKVNISGIPNGGRLDLFDKNGTIQTLTNGVNDIEGFTANGATGFLIYSGPELNWSNLVIQQIGQYEGAYCLDGVDDFVTIPTTVGGKQVLMKVNYRKSDCYLYDQRNNWTQYLGIVSTKDFIAYNYSNQRGKTYIDGILNENITANDLISITHNITVTNNRDDVEQYFPCIGTSFAKNSFAQMSLYDFMLFDNISTDDKIKELNEYVGIEGNTDDLFNETNI
ncbi:hypothetical protein [Bacteroides xylanisolvens]|uniref:hypothetical protein n=1 Tax=Bacteroides xylanisolvens TaxID=371601 RepID=UPI001C37C0F1|nr:hypothetical protein [Bacteroides xylanisolvens]MBV3838446.1 hypothetical protein [Bacteroides xylanisolvens]